MASCSTRAYVVGDEYCWATITLNVTESKVNLPDNTSEISYSFTGQQRLEYNFVGTTRENAGTVIVTINGEEVDSSVIALSNSKGSCSGSGTVIVPHNEDGTKTLEFAISMKKGDGNYSGDEWVYGNASASGTLKLTDIDYTAPIAGAVTNSDVTQNSAKISWSGFSLGHGATSGKYQYNYNGSWIDCGNSTSVSLTGLSPETKYIVYVRLVDNFGTASSNASTTFTTLSEQVKEYIKVNGTWKIGKVFIKVNGVWKKVKKLFIKENSSWRQAA